MPEIRNASGPVAHLVEPRARAPRSQAPVFVVGCPRSGTTVLYHMLLSAGNFAIYRAESNVLNLLEPKFGSLRSPQNRRRLLDAWLRSKLFQASGLESSDIEQKIMSECSSGADFLRITMEEMARKQGVERWAECTPEHLLHLPEIHRDFPDAFIIHIIRDGRDVALSYVKQKWVYPLPWDQHEHLAVAGMYWEWIVRRGREYGRCIGAKYREVRFEALIDHPRETLAELGEFIGHDLDYDRIQSAGIGSVSQPNTSFHGEAAGTGFHPVGRWKNKLSAEDIGSFEALVGDFLQELGYPLGSEERRPGLRAIRLRGTYFPYFTLKQWLKMNTPLARRVHTGRMEIAGPPPPR
jgi:hypothetical protein